MNLPEETMIVDVMTLTLQELDEEQWEQDEVSFCCGCTLTLPCVELVDAE